MFDLTIIFQWDVLILCIGISLKIPLLLPQGYAEIGHGIPNFTQLLVCYARDFYVTSRFSYIDFG